MSSAKANAACAAVLTFIKKNAVLCIAFLAAVITSCIVPIDSAYIGYFDFKTLTCLFCVLAVVCAFQPIPKQFPYPFPTIRLTKCRICR